MPFINRSWLWVIDVRRDVVHAARLLRRNPLVTTTAVLSLAIGIGASTTVFTVAKALLFQPSPGVAAPSRLVDIGATRQRGRLRSKLLSRLSRHQSARNHCQRRLRLFTVPSADECRRRRRGCGC